MVKKQSIVLGFRMAHFMRIEIGDSWIQQSWNGFDFDTINGALRDASGPRKG
jgi:hypothetical protein